MRDFAKTCRWHRMLTWHMDRYESLNITSLVCGNGRAFVVVDGAFHSQKLFEMDTATVDRELWMLVVEMLSQACRLVNCKSYIIPISCWMWWDQQSPNSVCSSLWSVISLACPDKLLSLITQASWHLSSVNEIRCIHNSTSTINYF